VFATIKKLLGVIDLVKFLTRFLVKFFLRSKYKKDDDYIISQTEKAKSTDKKKSLEALDELEKHINNS